ncbi:MAG: RES family NAD+ phosphorylase [Acidobacteriota bacterium]
MITTWRIVDGRYADDAFSGEGSRRYKGRWHSAGVRIVYTCASISLATLELLVRTPRAQLLRDYVVASCTFPEALVTHIDMGRLPKNWRDYPAPPLLADLGNEWIRTRTSAVLAVPSAVTPEELNYILNVEHEHFRSVDLGSGRPFRIDLRLQT